MRFAYFLFRSIRIFFVCTYFHAMEGVTTTYPICPVFTKYRAVYRTIELLFPFDGVENVHALSLCAPYLLIDYFGTLLYNRFHHQSEHVTYTIRIINGCISSKRGEFEITFPLL